MSITTFAIRYNMLTRHRATIMISTFDRMTMRASRCYHVNGLGRDMWIRRRLNITLGCTRGIHITRGCWRVGSSTDTLWVGIMKFRVLLSKVAICLIMLSINSVIIYRIQL
jgi:hypothetical protein